MKTYQKIVECFAVLSDPRHPDRPAAFDVHVVTMIDPEDGSGHFIDPRAPVRTLNVEQAKAEGLDIPQIAAAFESDALDDNIRLRARIAELEEGAERAARETQTR